MLTKEELEKKYPGKKIEKLKYLDLWGKDLENVDILSELKSLKIISLSGNKISSLKPFQELVNLKELFLRNNNISNLDEINYLKGCPKLKSLWLQENPICSNIDEYKKNIIEKLPNLETLDDTPINEIKNQFNKENKDNDKKKERENNETDIVIQGTEGNDEINKINENDNENNKNTNTKKQENNIIDDINDLILENEKKDKKEEDLKKTKNSLLSTNKENKLEDLILSYDKEESTKDKTNINEDNVSNNNLIDSKSDIFKTGFSYINKNETQNLNKEINNLNNNENNNINQENKEENNPINIPDIKNLSIKEPNNELLNDILRNVDTSQTFIKKANSNQIPSPNLENKINDNNNFTKNLNEMIANANINPNISQTYKPEGNTRINNILKDVKSSQTMERKNDNEIKKILGEINSSQTINKIQDQEVNNILKDVETTATNFNKVNNDGLINNNLKNNEPNKNLQSIDDIRKIFNNDYPSNNLYGNNIKDTRINNIFKSELINSETSSFFNKSNRGSEKNKPVIPKFSQNFHYEYENRNNMENDPNNNDNNGQSNKYNINPNHMHKINAIINLLEDLNLQNLLHVKNQIVKLIESKN